VISLGGPGFTILGAIEGVDGFLPEGLWGPRSDSTVHTLVNSTCQFVFTEDDRTGLRFSNFERTGGRTWENREWPLWRLLVFDSNSASSLRVLYVEPLEEYLTSVVSTATSLVAIWDQDIEGDTLQITVTLTLTDDRLEQNIACTWTTGLQYAVDSICLMPLRIDPFLPSLPILTDVACLGAAKGVIVAGPIHRMRWIPWDAAQPTSRFFGGKGKPYAVYPSGRSLSIPLWGYYSETLAIAQKEAWMAWYSNSNEVIGSTFGSDGQHMVLENYIPQGDNLLAGNGSETLAIIGQFNLRPFLTLTSNGWWDVADRYRQYASDESRLFYTNVLPLRTDLTPEMRKNPLWFNVSLATQTNPKNAEIITKEALERARLQIGVDEDTPTYGIAFTNIETGRDFLPLTGPLVIDEARWKQTSRELEVRNSHIGVHKPSSILPSPYNEAAFLDTEDWWADKAAINAIRVSRQGLLDGDTLATKGNSNSYYVEVPYSVQSYDDNTGLLTLQGSPLTVGQWAAGSLYTGAGVCYYVPTPPGKLARSRITSVATSDRTSEVIVAKFYDSSGAERFPVFGDIVYFFEQDPNWCWHALRHSSLRQWYIDNIWGQQRDLLGSGCFYLDVLPAQSLLGSDSGQLCHGDHSVWAEINAGYTRHPTGGGDWWVSAMRQWIRFILDELRRTRDGYVRIWAEYMSDVFNQEIEVCFHSFGITRLWRTTLPGDNKTSHGIRAAPMWSVIYAGRTYGCNLALSWGNQVFGKAYRNGTFWTVEGTTGAEKSRRTLAYCFGLDWIYGFCPMWYWHFSTQDREVDDPWDPFQTDASNKLGPADAECLSIRDYGLTMAQAEHKWVNNYLRNGQMLPKPTLQLSAPVPLLIDISATAVTEGNRIFGLIEFAPGVFIDTNGNRIQNPLLYDPIAFPVIQEQPWNNYLNTKAILCLYTNCFNAAGATRYTHTFLHYNLPAGETIHLFRVLPDGTTTFITSTAAATYDDVATLAAYDWYALLMAPEDQLNYLDSPAPITVDTPNRLRKGPIATAPQVRTGLPGLDVQEKVLVKIPVPDDPVDPGLGQEDPRFP